MRSNDLESTTPTFLRKVAAKVFRRFLGLVVFLVFLGAATPLIIAQAAAADYDAYQEAKAMADRYKKLYEIRQAEFDREHNPERQRRDELSAFLRGTAKGGAAGGGQGVENYRREQRKNRREDLDDLERLANEWRAAQERVDKAIEKRDAAIFYRYAKQRANRAIEKREAAEPLAQEEKRKCERRNAFHADFNKGRIERC